MNWLKALIAFSAVLVAGCAAYFSVTGLGILFSGASIAVMVMAGSLEFAKLVTASYLKQKWDEIQILFKIYLTTAVLILMVITSAGIFGYLSNAFQQQNLKIDQVSREIEVWNQKITQNESEIERYNKQLEGQIKIRESQEKNIQTSTEAGRGISRYSEMVKRADTEIGKISDKINRLNEENAGHYEKINQIKNDNIEIEREVGGFRFVADAFGIDLNYVVKIFIFLIVFVFDPLALALVIAFNQLNPSKKNKELEIDRKMYEVYGDEPKEEEKPIISSEKDAEVFFNAIENPPAPSDNLVKAAEKHKKEIIDEELSNLKQSIGKNEISVDGKAIGYDTDGDGLVDEPIGRSSIHVRELQHKKPYYARQNFDWSDRSKWINDQNAINYWLKYKRPEQERNNDNIKSY
jgi:hypothetical protein